MPWVLVRHWLLRWISFPWNFRSLDHSLLWSEKSKNFRSMELSYLWNFCSWGANSFRSMELSFPGTFAPILKKIVGSITAICPWASFGNGSMPKGARWDAIGSWWSRSTAMCQTVVWTYDVLTSRYIVTIAVNRSTSLIQVLASM